MERWSLLRAILAVIFFGLASAAPGLAALAVDPDGSAFSGDPAALGQPSRAQSDDEGWLLKFRPDLPPGVTAAEPPDSLLVDETSDRVYAASRGGEVMAFDRRTQQRLGAARVEHTIESTAAHSAEGRLFAAGVRYDDQSVRLTILRLPGLEIERTVQLAEAASLRQVVCDARRRLLYALVAHPQSDAFTGELIVLDTRGNTARAPLYLGANPTSIAVDGQTGRVFALAPDFQAQAATLRAYDAAGAGLGETRLRQRALRMILDESRRRIYAVATDDPAGGVLVSIDVDSLAVRGETIVGRLPSAMALDPNSGYVWLSTMRAADTDPSPTLEVVEPGSGKTIALVPHNRPAGIISLQGLAADGQVRRLWVANQDNSLSVLDLDSRRPLGTIILGETVDDVGVDEQTGRIFVPSGNADVLYAVEPAGGGIVGRLPVGRQPTSIRVDGESGRVYVLNRTGRSLSIVDGRALSSLAEVHLAAAPGNAGWDVDPGLGRAYLLLKDEVVAISLDDGREVGRATVEATSGYHASLTVDASRHLVYVTGYASAILDGRTLATVGKLPASPLSLLIDQAAQRAYAVNWCVAKGCGIRTYVYDLRDHSLLAQLEGVGEVQAVNHNLGHLYFSGSPAFVVDAYSFEKTRLDWRSTDLAADARRGRIYLLDASEQTLRAVPDEYPRSEPALRQSYSARIEIVWPHDGAPVREANLANVGAMIFQPTTYRPVSANFAGAVQLWRALNNEPAVPVATGLKRIAPWPTLQPEGCASAGYPMWEFNDVDVSLARDPNNKVFFYLTVDGLAARTSIWSHAVDARTYFPYQDVPAGTAAVGSAVDTRIQIVWPHDGAGREQPVSEARFANVGVHVYNHGTTVSVPVEWEPVVKLYRALNNGVEQYVGTGVKEVVTQGGRSWPRWVFYDVDVRAARDAANRYYFRAVVEGMPTYAGVWSHGVDGRTFFPQQDIPVSGCR